MCPLFVNAEGRGDDALADRKRQLQEIERLAAELIESESATGSKRSDRWITIEHTAKYLQLLIDHGGLETYLDFWAPEVSQELRICLLDEKISTPIQHKPGSKSF